MKFSLRYGLSPQDMFLLLPILKRLARKRRRFDANMKKRKIWSVLKSALQFERAKDLIRERNYLIAASLMPAVSGTPWYHMYSYANDPSLINVISLPRFALQSSWRSSIILQILLALLTGVGQLGSPFRM